MRSLRGMEKHCHQTRTVSIRTARPAATEARMEDGGWKRPQSSQGNGGGVYGGQGMTPIRKTPLNRSQQREQSFFSVSSVLFTNSSSACICVICGQRSSHFLCLFGSAEVAKRKKAFGQFFHSFSVKGGRARTPCAPRRVPIHRDPPFPLPVSDASPFPAFFP